MIRYMIPIAPMSKPRGQLGKYGNITHSIGGYRDWQRNLARKLASVKFTIPTDYFALIIILHISKNKRGRSQDVDDMIGGFFDSLVKFDFIKDDNWRIVTRYWSEAIQGDRGAIEVFVATSLQDVSWFFSNREKFNLPR